jgi:hypothetical protein
VRLLRGNLKAVAQRGNFGSSQLLAQREVVDLDDDPVDLELEVAARVDQSRQNAIS